MSSISENKSFCRYNAGVDCLQYYIHKAKANGEEYPECEKCGWNPGVSAERIYKMREKMRGENTNA